MLVSSAASSLVPALSSLIELVMQGLEFQLKVD